MKPHPRIRKTIKWGGAAVTVLLAAVWIGSQWWNINWYDPSREFDVHLMAGTVGWSYREMWSLYGRVTPGWTLERFDLSLEWGVHYRIENGRLSFRVPLWPLVFAGCVATIAAWRLDMLARRHARLKFCAKCGYDLAGIAMDAKCPECGTSG